jgi:hypothetical protein
MGARREPALRTEGMTRTTGACLGLLAFSTAILAGVSIGNPVATTLSRALWAMVAFYILGAVLGHVAMRVIDEYAVQQNEALFGDNAALAVTAPGDPSADGTNGDSKSQKTT